jgi:uncharacterized protein with von Willebrand factor type A (vWA) domain
MADTTAEEVAVGFARVLRGLGVSVPIGCVIDFGEAIGLLGIDRRDAVYWAGRTTLVHRPEDLGTYDRAFTVFWEQQRPTADEQPTETQHVVVAVDDGEPDTDADPHTDADPDALFTLVRAAFGQRRLQAELLATVGNEFTQARGAEATRGAHDVDRLQHAGLSVTVVTEEQVGVWARLEVGGLQIAKPRPSEALQRDVAAGTHRATRIKFASA